MPVPVGVAVGDLLVAVVANAGTAGPATPTGWTSIYAASAGSGQNCAVFTAPYSAGLTRAFTNAASAAVAVCGAYYEAGRTVALDVAAVAAVSTTNNTTLPTGAPTTGTLAGDFEVLAYAHTAAPTVTTTASGSTIDLRAVNGTACTAILGHNNTTSLGASTACTAFSHTLSASNNRKTGVGILLESVVLKALTGAAAGAAVPSGAIGRAVSLTGAAAGATAAAADLTKFSTITYRDLTGATAGRGQVGTAFLWGLSNWGAAEAVWGATGVTVITGGPPPPGPKYLTGSAVGGAVTTALPARRRPLVAAAAGTSTEVGTVTARRRLVAAAVGVTAALGFVDIAGSVFRPIFGGASGRTTVVVAVSRRRALVATAVVGRATTTAVPSRRRALLATAVLGQATTTAVVGRKRSLLATAVLGQATASGTITSVPLLPLTSVIWVVDHFEQGVVGTLVLWDATRFVTTAVDGEAQVVWEEEVFKVFQP